MGLLEIILIVVLVLFLAGAVGTGRPFRQEGSLAVPGILWVLVVIVIIVLVFRLL